MVWFLNSSYQQKRRSHRIPETPSCKNIYLYILFLVIFTTFFFQFHTHKPLELQTHLLQVFFGFSLVRSVWRRRTSVCTLSCIPGEENLRFPTWNHYKTFVFTFFFQILSSWKVTKCFPLEVGGIKMRYCISQKNHPISWYF